MLREWRAAGTRRRLAGRELPNPTCKCLTCSNSYRGACAPGAPYATKEQTRPPKDVMLICSSFIHETKTVSKPNAPMPTDRKLRSCGHSHSGTLNNNQNKPLTTVHTDTDKPHSRDTKWEKPGGERIHTV